MIILPILMGSHVRASPIANESSTQLQIGAGSKNNISMRPLSNIQLADEYYRHGIDMQSRGETLAAITNFEHSLLLNKNDPAAAIALARLYYSNEDYQASITLASDSLKLHPNSRELFIQLAHDYSALHLYKKVIKTLDGRPGTLGSEAQSSSLLAYAFIKTGEFTRASDIYHSLKLTQPKKPVWWLGSAIALEGSGDIEKALLAYVDLKEQYSLSKTLKHFVNSKIVSLHKQQQSSTR
ncbi:MAG: tetratricopeptide repeat protein [Thiohalomonadales bacterium]